MRTHNNIRRRLGKHKKQTTKAALIQGFCSFREIEFDAVACICMVICSRLSVFFHHNYDNDARNHCWCYLAHVKLWREISNINANLLMTFVSPAVLFYLFVLCTEICCIACEAISAKKLYLKIYNHRIIIGIKLIIM